MTHASRGRYRELVPFEHLDQPQSVALLEEIASTRNLLGYGVKVLRTGAFIETTKEPILTLLSIGLEKLYKLTIGLADLDLNHEWPTAATMRDFGHDITRLHERVMGELRARTAESTDFVRGLVADVDSDPMVPLLIHVLHNYGDRGRFYYLDRLGNRTQDANPSDAWDQFERAALDDPIIADLMNTAAREVGSREAWNRFERALHERLAGTVESVWIMVSMCGQNHALGKNGALFGVEVDPRNVGRQ